MSTINAIFCIKFVIFSLSIIIYCNFIQKNTMQNKLHSVFTTASVSRVLSRTAIYLGRLLPKLLNATSKGHAEQAYSSYHGVASNRVYTADKSPCLR